MRSEESRREMLIETLGPIETQRRRCQDARDALREATRIHVKIDAPERQAGADEPDWVFRLRKVCLHADAICRCELDVDGVHAIATELRAAYAQMAVIWEHLPDGCRFEADRDWWATEASDLLAEYDHPTPLGLMMPLSIGGFGDDQAPDGHLRLACWLGRLACGYGSALDCLAIELGTKVDVRPLQAALQKGATS